MSSMHDSPEPPDLQVFGPVARRAIVAAEAEARALGHGRVGTEHLLLGVLADESSTAARVLSEAGARLPVVRHRVLEALPPPLQPEPNQDHPLALTARATRALRRSVRSSHRRRDDGVTAEDLLIGVLDVEGTAGQVLRSLVLDVEGLRAALDAGEAGMPNDETAAGGEDQPMTSPPLCPSCGAAVAGDLTYQIVRARGERGPLDALVFSCGRCGTVVGAAPD